MDAPVYKKLTDIENTNENPMGTKEGQQVVSISESMIGRLLREGKYMNAYVVRYSAPNYTDEPFWGVNLSPDKGHSLYPINITVSSNVDTVLHVKFDININSSNPILLSCYAKAGTPWVLNFDGGIKTYASGGIHLGCSVTGYTSGVQLTASILALEVPENV